MSALSLREYRLFEAAGLKFLYLVPSAGVFAVDDCSSAVLQCLRHGACDAATIVVALSSRFDVAEVTDTIAELQRMRAIGDPVAHASPKILPLTPVPLRTLVVNVTNQCNLSCTYCYEYGEDKIVDTANGKQPKFMSEETARASVEFMLRQSDDGATAHMTFFGGETLMNFPVLKSTLEYAHRRAAELGKLVDFSLTTNATLLRPEIIDFLAENRVGVTISIDGPEELQDKFRVFKNGKGSYVVAAPKIKALLERHRSRPIGARVTLTHQTLHVKRIFRHLTEEMGFWEVGFAPVTTAPQRGYAIGDSGFDDLLTQFRALAHDYKQAALEHAHHGFSNVRETLQEIHQGHAKAYPCGAGFGLMGVATDGEIALCHRFAGSHAHKMGDVRHGVSWDRQQAFLESHHVNEKTECQTCWARPICAGGCYHEANTRYGSTGRPNLHYCEWIRGWTQTCLEIYGEIAVRNPEFLRQFDDEPAERVSKRRAWAWQTPPV
jgi:uncharacterized protein